LPRSTEQDASASDRHRPVQFKPNERITLTRNPDYWKKGRPYLDGIEFTIIREVATAKLAFIAKSNSDQTPRWRKPGSNPLGSRISRTRPPIVREGTLRVIRLRRRDQQGSTRIPTGRSVSVTDAFSRKS
jgi:hypothetical protein